MLPSDCLIPYAKRQLLQPGQSADYLQLISTSSKHGNRFVFALGDYVKFRNDRFGRIDHIMLFDVMAIHRNVFVILTELKTTGIRDPVLDLEVLAEARRQIAGISAILPEKPYMVPINNVGTVLVEWDAHSM